MEAKSAKSFYIVSFAIILTFPLFLSSYIIYILDIIGIYAILAIGLNLVMGYTGQISLGHAAFAAIGAYTTGLLKVKLGVPFLVAWPIGALFAGIIGFLLGLPALRLRGHYLALATIGFGISIQLVILRWDSLTYGPRGFDMPPVSFFGFELNSDKEVFYLIMVAAFLMILLAKNIVSSRNGRAFLAIRDSEIASQSLGINLARYKTIAFALSAFYGGVAGGLYAALIRYVSADNFGLFDTITYLTMIVIGGLASIAGSVIGVALVMLVQEGLRGFQEYQGLIYGVAVVVFIIFMPDGVYGLFLKVKSKFQLARP